MEGYFADVNNKMVAKDIEIVQGWEYLSLIFYKRTA
jgi:hypothetical protein